MSTHKMRWNGHYDTRFHARHCIDQERGGGARPMLQNKPIPLQNENTNCRYQKAKLPNGYSIECVTVDSDLEAGRGQFYTLTAWWGAFSHEKARIFKSFLRDREKMTFLPELLPFRTYSMDRKQKLCHFHQTSSIQPI